nr:integrase, catalytic region, zinc finger, CCHC-type, peptidase aspartic, catalytic [Tanacetum cinerariifolium]
MLLDGFELTTKDRESQLYDEFERFKMILGENITDYCVRFHKLVNDMRNIKMTMPNIQLNSKFVNNMKPKWDRHIVRNCTQPKRPQNSDYFKEKMILMQAQENGAVLDEEELLFLAEETLEINETTRQKKSEKMNDPEEHFEGVQKTLATEVKKMKDIFKSMEAEVDQNAIDLRSGEIERKNLLIKNENLIAKCIAPDVFYTVKHFEGVQKTLATEVKKMKEIFKSMEAEVDQNAIDLRSGEIERKNLLIKNENLIAKCIAPDVFYTVSNFVLTASQFHELSIAYNVAQTRAVELEAENLNLHKKSK